jgi:hypothetical protein
MSDQASSRDRRLLTIASMATSRRSSGSGGRASAFCVARLRRAVDLRKTPSTTAATLAEASVRCIGPSGRDPIAAARQPQAVVSANTTGTRSVDYRNARVDDEVAVPKLTRR